MMLSLPTKAHTQNSMLIKMKRFEFRTWWEERKRRVRLRKGEEERWKLFLLSVLSELFLLKGPNFRRGVHSMSVHAEAEDPLVGT
jgi:hypothetical protein